MNGDERDAEDAAGIAPYHQWAWHTRDDTTGEYVAHGGDLLAALARTWTILLAAHSARLSGHREGEHDTATLTPSGQGEIALRPADTTENGENGMAYEVACTGSRGPAPPVRPLTVHPANFDALVHVIRQGLPSAATFEPPIPTGYELRPPVADAIPKT